MQETYIVMAPNSFKANQILLPANQRFFLSPLCSFNRRLLRILSHRSGKVIALNLKLIIVSRIAPGVIFSVQDPGYAVRIKALGKLAIVRRSYISAKEVLIVAYFIE